MQLVALCYNVAILPYVAGQEGNRPCVGLGVTDDLNQQTTHFRRGIS